jgi:hypothetical protein
LARKRTFGNYFSFKYMITPDIIKIIHVIGLIILNLALLGGLVAGIIFLFSQDLDLEGYMMALVIVGAVVGAILAFFIVNIEWRIICETMILFFSMHEMLSTVEGELREVNKKVVEHPEEEEEDEDEEDDDDD